MTQWESIGVWDGGPGSFRGQVGRISENLHNDPGKTTGSGLACNQERFTVF
jgi:hypothetical protein